MNKTKSKSVSLDPHFFPSQDDFRKWLETKHKTEKELIVGYYKKGSGKPSMTWPESVDQALCFGWIDGVRRSIDEECYCIRFTPRRTGSVWSIVNIKKIKDLMEKGLMHPSGLQAFSKMKPSDSGLYSFEKNNVKLHDHLEEEFKINEKAWGFFSCQAPSYQKMVFSWIMSAKQEKTRMIRLKRIIDESKKNNRIFW